MNAALADFKALMLSSRYASMYEAFFVGSWLAARDITEIHVPEAEDAVRSLFEVVPTVDLGRIAPFRYDWRKRENSARSTVWNVTSSRQVTSASLMMVSGDIRNGIHPDAASTVADTMAGKPKPAKQALIALFLRGHSFSPGDDWASAEEALLNHLRLSQAQLDMVADDRELGVPLLGADEWSPDTLDESLAPPSSVTVIVPPATSGSSGTVVTPSVRIVVDPRVKRMLLRSIQHYPCVLLVGPPGTGKGTLVRWLISHVELSPAEFGFDPSLVPNAMWRTPDESWSAFELVGGLAPNEQAHLMWSNGLLLNSIKENSWLVLDETNRADLDKIMGPLLTWLSEQEVEVGRTKPHGGEPIRLGWADGHGSIADELDPVGEPTRYLAGRDWRLLGTYNPQDAQRVFRMGQALSRRFVVVPVPALQPGQFESLLDDTYPGLSDDAKVAISALYSAHHSSAETLLGPAVFLRLGKYLVGVADDVPEHLAEAYVVNVGKFLSAFDDVTFEALGTRIVDDEQAMTREQWEWTVSQRLTLG